MGSNDPVAIQVQNLSKFRSALKQAGPGLVEQVKATNYQVASSVAQSARTLASSQGGVAARTAPSIRGIKSSASSQVRIGGANYPFALGAEFGSLRYKQFKSWRGNQWAAWGASGVGYFLHPTIRAQRDQIMQTYGDNVEKIMTAAFPG
ncbi:hypothetical protein acdb102_31260 [Acidothermaceae bacterium B102]|nr:hypothetical protein acdb102_31260 [Acidothermaceae bacterium B102]